MSEPTPTPDTAAEAARRWSSHGHWIGEYQWTSEDEEQRPSLIARCGGPGMCSECKAEQQAFWRELAAARSVAGTGRDLCTVDECPAAPRCSSGATVWHNRTPECPPSTGCRCGSQPGRWCTADDCVNNPDRGSGTAALTADRDETGTSLIMSAVVMGADFDVDTRHSGPGKFSAVIGDRTYVVRVKDVTEAGDGDE